MLLCPGLGDPIEPRMLAVASVVTQETEWLAMAVRKMYGKGESN